MGFARPSLKARALRYLAAREHSRTELTRKLTRHLAEDEDPAAIEQVLDELTKKGFIDHSRVVDFVLRQRAPRLGNARVLHEMREKGLSQEEIASAMDQLRATELERAQAVWLKKFGEPPADARERARQLRFLAGRGFSAPVANRVLRLNDKNP